ncbi:uncharacterized protein LOC123528163 [Mercenaria mercenaria]|uniref:uncharacterized protein LOC123528163 n=1 Tax=Mercenaria mercenaria TaxID=6596 RepID=UPI001E1D8B12|nr:uncharacterized protein LOC123528163 [Mercenaria mercenaria]
MELPKSKSCLNVCLVVVFLLGVLTNFSKAVSPDQLQTAGWSDQVDQGSQWQMAFREELRRELAEFAETEERILAKIRELNKERENIRTMKRGHTQCFLNLVSCYRKRK